MERRPWWRFAPAITAGVVWLGLLALTLVPEWRAGVATKLTWMLPPLYHDWHVLRLGWFTAAAGEDPLAASGSPFNYPRIVLAPQALGVHHLPAEVAGLLLAGATLGVMVAFLRPQTCRQALAASVLLVSPPVLLLLERGNLDAIALVLVAAGLALAARPDRPVVWGAGVLALCGAALIKWYPVVVLLLAAGTWRGGRRLALAAGFAAVAGWVALHPEEVALVMQKTTRGLVPAYGRMLLGSRYYVEAVRGTLEPAEAAAWLSTAMRLSLGACVLGYAAAALVGWRLRPRFAPLRVAAAPTVLFLAGAAVYAGTFLLGNNWSYRLVFLLLTVPWLWQARHHAATRHLATGGLAAVAIVLLAPFQLALPAFVLVQAVGWLLAGAAVAGVVALAGPVSGDGGGGETGESIRP